MQDFLDTLDNLADVLASIDAESAQRIREEIASLSPLDYYSAAGKLRLCLQIVVKHLPPDMI